jgi:hypothetical protein
MAKKVKVIIRFVNNPDLQFVMKNDGSEVTDEQLDETISTVARYLSEASYFRFEVMPENAGTTKTETVVLANEALKNAYIVVRELA